MMYEWITAIGLLVGTLMAFRWLYETVAEESVGWWDSISLVFAAALVGRVLRFIVGKIPAIPNWTASAAMPVVSVAVMYLALRLWMGLKPKHAAAIAIAWLPILIAILVIFFLVNPGILR